MGALRIGTRRSALARWQAGRVQQLLAACSVASKLVPITTCGDRDSTPPWPTDAVKGLFTREIEEALLAGKVDVAVHSLKDLSVQLADGLLLAAVPEREDPRDALVSRRGGGLEDLAPGARVGTSSLRRAAAVRSARSDLVTVPLRGNVPTRVARVEEGFVDGAVLALAGLKRLGLSSRARPLDPERFVPAAGQGALAVQARADDRATIRLLAPLDCPQLRTAVEAERAALTGLGAACDVPVGALCQDRDGSLVLHVAVYDARGRPPVTVSVTVDPAHPAAAGAAAASELARRGAAIVG